MVMFVSIIFQKEYQATIIFIKIFNLNLYKYYLFVTYNRIMCDA